MMTNQEIFDKVATHLLTQGKRSETVAGDCAYRGADGTKCAAGVLIADEFYRPEFEGIAITVDRNGDDLEPQAERVRQALFKSGLKEWDQLRLVRALQKVHDREEPEDWCAALLVLADHFDLSPAVLEVAR